MSALSSALSAPLSLPPGSFALVSFAWFGYLARGLAIGLAIAAPVGPIGALCIRRTLVDGRLIGLATGLGAATADGAYGAVAAFGVTAVTSALVGLRLWIHLGGALFLAYLGARSLLACAPKVGAAGAGPSSGVVADPLSAWASTVALTLTNPATILSFAAVFAGLGLAGAGDGAAGATVAGVFLGSALWWLVLTTTVGLVRSRLDARGLRWVNRVSGLILLGFAVLALLTMG